MKKILYVDNSIRGHHYSYFTSLIQNLEYESILILPEKAEGINCKQYIYKTIEPKKRKFSFYYKWIREILKIVRSEKPDFIHFLYGDLFYRFFGIGLYLFKGCYIVITLHEARTGFLKQLSTRIICKNSNITIVHSEYLKKRFNAYGAKNVVCIEYPQFNTFNIAPSKARKYFGLQDRVPVILCIGATEYYKGLDILLCALNEVEHPFQLLIAGLVKFFDEADIMTRTRRYKDNVHLYLKYLSEEEFASAICACDIIALPYRNTFNGASGPLGEGVFRRKCIVGTEFGNIGYTIMEHHLGYTFIAEDSQSLAIKLNKALIEQFKINHVYEKYRESLNQKFFVEKYKKVYEMVAYNSGWRSTVEPPKIGIEKS